jgi:hypothetical protein
MSNLTNKQYDLAEIEWLKANRPSRCIKDVVKAFNEHFGTNYTESMIKHRCFKHGIKALHDGKFKPKNDAWNKGMDIKIMRPDIYRQFTSGQRYCFQKGQLPKSTKPVGSEKVTRDGIIVKVAMPNVWKFKSRLVYEQHYGVELGEKDRILHLNGNKMDCSIDNLILVNDAILARLNKRGLINKNKEITKSAVFSQKILQKIKELEERNKDGK